MHPARLAVFDASLDGHRAANLRILCRHLGGEPVVGVSRRSFVELLRAGAVIFATVEGSVKFAAVCAGLRALAGRPTALLAHRAHYATRRRSARGQVKRAVWWSLHRFPRVTVLAVVPDRTVAGILPLSIGIIDDPQSWDLDDEALAGPVEVPRAVREVQEAAGTRPVVLSAGHQAPHKGTEYFFQIWDQPGIRERFLFVACGQVDPLLKTPAEAFRAAGGRLDDRFVDDDELLALFGIATLVWCCYHESYDHSSGILGRAMQFQKPVIARAGSMLGKVVEQRRAGLTVRWAQPEETARMLLAFDPAEAASNGASPSEMRARSLALLRGVLRLTEEKASMPDRLAYKQGPRG